MTITSETVNLDQSECRKINSHLEIYTNTLIDKLTKNLVINAIENDRRENLNKRPMDRSNKNLDALIKCIRSCGISFNVWEKAEEDCRGGLYEFTSLMGSDKRLLLKTLPSKLATILPDNTSGDNC